MLLIRSVLFACMLSGRASSGRLANEKGSSCRRQLQVAVVTGNAKFVCLSRFAGIRFYSIQGMQPAEGKRPASLWAHPLFLMKHAALHVCRLPYSNTSVLVIKWSFALDHDSRIELISAM